MNGTLFFVLMVVSVVMCAGVLQTWIKQKHSKSESGAEIEATLNRIDHLEERIKVLERIITENRFDLKSEIDSL